MLREVYGITRVLFERALAGEEKTEHIFISSMWKACGKVRQAVVRGSLIGDRFATQEAAVMYSPLSFSLLDPDRFHAAAAERGPVAGPEVVDVLGPQADGAVVPVAATFERPDLGAAVLAREGLLAGDEDHARRGERARRMRA